MKYRINVEASYLSALERLADAWFKYDKALCFDEDGNADFEAADEAHEVLNAESAKIRVIRLRSIRAEDSSEIPAGFCQCGCGQRTKLADQTLRRQGWIKGQPQRFIHGHHQRKVSA